MRLLLAAIPCVAVMIATLIALPPALAQTCNCTCDATIPPCYGVARVFMNESGGPPTNPTMYLTAGISHFPAPPSSAEVRHANRFFITPGTTLTHVCVALKNPSGPAATACAGGDQAYIFIAVNDQLTNLPGAFIGGSQTNFIVQPCIGLAVHHQLVAFSTPQQFPTGADVWVGVGYPTADVGIGHQGNRDRTGGSSAVWIGGTLSQWYSYDDPQLTSFNLRAPIIRGLELVRSGGRVDAFPVMGLITDEYGGSAQFQVTLAPAPPTANVTVSISTTDATEGIPAAGSASLTFTPLNWNVPQTVTVIGQDDPLVDGSIPYQIRGFSTSTDLCYHSPTTPVFTVDLTNLDNDGPCQLRWARLTGGPTPPARELHAMAYDPVRRKVVLFGGRDMTGTPLLDVWEFDPATNLWAQIPALIGPLPRFQHAMAWDQSLGKVVVIGGTDGINIFPETWGWNGAAWSMLAPPPGPPRSRSAACIYPLGGDIVRCGGQNAAFALVPDVNEFLVNTWIPGPPMPSPRAGHAAAPLGSGPVIVFGGENPIGGTMFGDTWRYGSGSWTPVPGPPSPSARRDLAMATFPRRNAVALFGGEVFTFTRSPETWLFSLLGGWTAQNTAGSPTGRSGHAMAAIDPDGSALLFGGHDNSGIRNDTWLLSDPYYPIITATGDLITDSGTTFTQAVSVSGAGTFFYLWIKDGVPLSNGPRISGADSPVLTIGPALLADEGHYWCRVSSACGGSSLSNSAFVDIRCIADFDGNHVVNVADIFAFLSAWFAHDPRADVGPPPGIQVSDIFIYLSAWFTGCP